MDNKVAVETINAFRISLNTDFYLKLEKTLPSFRHSLISFSSLGIFGYSCFIGNEICSVSLNSNIVETDTWINKLYKLNRQASAKMKTYIQVT